MMAFYNCNTRSTKASKPHVIMRWGVRLDWRKMKRRWLSTPKIGCVQEHTGAMHTTAPYTKHTHWDYSLVGCGRRHIISCILWSQPRTERGRGQSMQDRAAALGASWSLPTHSSSHWDHLVITEKNANTHALVHITHTHANVSNTCIPCFPFPSLSLSCTRAKKAPLK